MQTHRTHFTHSRHATHNALEFVGIFRFVFLIIFYFSFLSLWCIAINTLLFAIRHFLCLRYWADTCRLHCVVLLLLCHHYAKWVIYTTIYEAQFCGPIQRKIRSFVKKSYMHNMDFKIGRLPQKSGGLAGSIQAFSAHPCIEPEYTGTPSTVHTTHTCELYLCRYGCAKTPIHPTRTYGPYVYESNYFLRLFTTFPQSAS